jgi:ABC-type Mn2+/Zn2+ transport system permease subunit
MIEVVAVSVLFAVLFNWAVNVQVLANYEENKRDRLIAIVLSFVLAVVLGIISQV